MRVLELTSELLRERFIYDELSGNFIRRIKIGRCRAGQICNYVNRNGYVEIGIGNRAYPAHRLAWLYMTGDWPPMFVDHINGCKTDNRWCNLREATPILNQQNRHKAKSNNSTGLLGVRRRFRYGKDEWSSQIYLDGKHIHIGYFKTPEQAHAAYVEKKRELHPGGTL